MRRVARGGLHRARRPAAPDRGDAALGAGVLSAVSGLGAAERGGDRYDTIVVDPPAFAKSRSAIDGALRGYKDINLRAMRLLTPGGMLFTASCSFHLSRPLFHEMLEAAAADSGRRIVLRELQDKVVDLGGMRALGFCVSVAHAFVTLERRRPRTRAAA